MIAIVLEDSPSTMLVLRNTLRAMGYQVVEHRGTFSAMETLRRQVDLYVIDASVRRREHEDGIPGNGVVVANVVRTSYPDARVIVCSADPKWRTEAERLGARFVLKSVNLAADIERSLA